MKDGGGAESSAEIARRRNPNRAMPVWLRIAVQTIVFVGGMSGAADTAFACQGSRQDILPTFEQARQPPIGMISFIGKLIVKDQPGLKFEISERIEGNVKDGESVVLHNCLIAGQLKIGDVVPVVAKRDEDQGRSFLWAVGQREMGIKQE